MAAKFTIEMAETESGLSAADTALAQKSSSGLTSVCVGGYGTMLLEAGMCARVLVKGHADARAVANTGSREFSITTVQSAEAANTSTLTT